MQNFAGDKQSEVVNSYLEKPIRVQVLDENFQPKEGVKVFFDVLSTPKKAKNAHIEPNVVLTDKEGYAISQITLGSKSGEYLFSAKIVNNSLSNNLLIFSSEARKSNWVFLLVMGLFGGLGLFLFGMEMMSDGMKKSAGDQMRTILRKLTHNRLMAMFIGTIVTMVIQSSSATTVMLVSFVQAQLMTFTQTLGIILGADIGTTITGQIVALKLTDYALLIVAVGFAFTFMGKSDKLKNIGETVLGFGLLFFGMDIMSHSMYPLRTYQPFIDLLLVLENPLLGIFVGAVFTALIQSSSAFTGIVIVLATQGLLTLEASIPMLFGSNIGTCATAFLAGIGASREAKKVAYAHILFKFVGVFIFVWFIPQLAELVRWVSPQGNEELTGMALLAEVVPRQTANAHTIFNVIMAFLFLPFINQFAKIITKFFPDVEEPKELEIVTWHIDYAIIETPTMALELAREEVSRMFKIVSRMLNATLHPFVSEEIIDDEIHTNLSLLEGIRLREQKTNYLNEKLTDYLLKISREKIQDSQAVEVFVTLSIVKDLERIGDIVFNNILPLVDKKNKTGKDFSEEGKEELASYHKKVMKQVNRCTKAFTTLDLNKARKILIKGSKYNDLEAIYRLKHFERIYEEVAESIATDEVHLELIDYFKQVNVHLENIAKSILVEINNEVEE
ncbi:MAG: Na/Pi cotransporter family protein [Calditrichaeota bacterium]|nr:MAG: Na/Pi cotransporter family protein [Calditrichota bacterium]